MSSIFESIEATAFGSIVNVLRTASELGMGVGGAGCAASARMAILGQPANARMVALADAELFEVGATSSSVGVLVDDVGPGSELAIPIRTSSVSEGMVVVAIEGDIILGASQVAPGSLVPSSQTEFLGGELITALTSKGQVTETATVFAMSLKAGVAGLLVLPAIIPLGGFHQIVLDGVYTSIKRGEIVVLKYGNVLNICPILSVLTMQFDVTFSDFNLPFTRIWITSTEINLDQDQENLKQGLEIWFNSVQAGELVRLPAPTGSPSQVLATAEIDPAASAPLAIVDATGTAILVTTIADIPDTSLTLPATIYSNLALATRGETIKNEPLGSGDASIPFQSFRLKKSPLTYLADPTAPNGRRSTLEVYVNGQKWRQAQSFYGALPTDPIYVVRHDEDHQTHVVFGDGELGQRVPTGSNNVVATYRFGVGGNVPANSITTLKKPIKGIRKVFNPLPATGGKEPPTPEQMRREAPLGLLVLGRLVSLPDFEAETRRYGNVVNAKARWGWNSAGEDATVQVWFATRDAGDPSADLRVYLEGMAEPNTQVSVAKATPVSGALKIDLVIDPRERAEDVELEVARRLFDDWDGVFSVRNAEIGGRFHRSAIYAAIHAVPGVLGVNAITVNDVDVPAFHAFEEGTYLDLENTDLIVGNTAAGLRLFGSN